MHLPAGGRSVAVAEVMVPHLSLKPWLNRLAGEVRRRDMNTSRRA